MSWQIFERAGRLADSFVGLLGNRLSLFGLELQEELERLLAHLAMLFLAVLLAGLGMLSLSAAVLILAARHGWLLSASLCLALVYALAAALCGFGLWRRLQAAPEPFAATRAEFERDRVCLHAPKEEAP